MANALPPSIPQFHMLRGPPFACALGSGSAAPAPFLAAAAALAFLASAAFASSVFSAIQQPQLDLRVKFNSKHSTRPDDRDQGRVHVRALEAQVYEGAWVHGERHGWGELHSLAAADTLDEYKGQWRLDVRCGWVRAVTC